MKATVLLLLFSGLLAAHCSITNREPIYSKTTENNKDYKVQYLFEHDGCKVYRFMDYGNWVYFTSCRGETMTQADSATVIRNMTDQKH